MCLATVLTIVRVSWWYIYSFRQVVAWLHSLRLSKPCLQGQARFVSEQQYLQTFSGISFILNICGYSFLMYITFHPLTPGTSSQYSSLYPERYRCTSASLLASHPLNTGKGSQYSSPYVSSLSPAASSSSSSATAR